MEGCRQTLLWCACTAGVVNVLAVPEAATGCTDLAAPLQSSPRTSAEAKRTGLGSSGGNKPAVGVTREASTKHGNSLTRPTLQSSTRGCFHDIRRLKADIQAHNKPDCRRFNLSQQRFPGQHQQEPRASHRRWVTFSRLRQRVTAGSFWALG